jgi:hypothetical protein
MIASTSGAIRSRACLTWSWPSSARPATADDATTAQPVMAH